MHNTIPQYKNTTKARKNHMYREKKQKYGENEIKKNNKKTQQTST